MTITYAKNYFRAAADKPRMILPNDAARAAANGYEKTTCVAYPQIEGPVGELVAALARKNWDVPGVLCEFDVLGTTDKPLHQIYRVSGGVQGLKWKIEFCRPVYRCDDRNVLSEPSCISIPGHELELDEDGLSSYYRYVGDDWCEDEERFHGMVKIDAKKKGQDRLYLLYELHTEKYRHTTNCGEEYERNDDDPISYGEQAVYDTFTTFLDTVRMKIEKTPDVYTDPYEAWEKAAEVKPLPVPEGVGAFYVIMSSYGATSYKDGIVWAGGTPMFKVSDDIKEKYPTSPLVEGRYQYGFANKPFQSELGWGESPASANACFVKVNLKYANDIYVADERPVVAANDYFRAEALKYNVDVLDDDEVGQLRQILGNTIVPLAEYKNDYTSPIFLIDRPLWENEAQHITQDIRAQMGKLTSSTQDGYHQRLFNVMKNAL